MRKIWNVKWIVASKRAIIGRNGTNADKMGPRVKEYTRGIRKGQTYFMNFIALTLNHGAWGRYNCNPQDTKLTHYVLVPN